MNIVSAPNLKVSFFITSSVGAAVNMFTSKLTTFEQNNAPDVPREEKETHSAHVAIAKCGDGWLWGN